MGESYTFVTKANFGRDDDKKTVWIPSNSDINDAVNKCQKQLQKCIDNNISNISRIEKDVKELKSRIETYNKTVQQLHDNFESLRKNLNNELNDALQQCLQKTIMKHYELLSSLCQTFPSATKLTSTMSEIDKTSKQIEDFSIEISKIRRAYHWLTVSFAALVFFVILNFIFLFIK